MQTSLDRNPEADDPSTAVPRDGAPSWRAKLVNFAVFQVVYVACVFGAAGGNAWIGPLAGAVLLPLNLPFAADRRRELRLWALAGVVGLAVDSAFLSAGLIGFPEFARLGPEFGWPAALVPLWIVTLWVAFGSLLTSSLAWLGRSSALAVAFGAVGGPFSFWSGSKIGATELPGGSMAFVALGLEYAVLLPILLRIARRPEAAPASLDDHTGAASDAAPTPSTASR